LTAPSLYGPWNETRTFGWNSDCPLSSTNITYNVNKDFPQLKKCIVLSEPSAVVRQQGATTIIDLTMGCVKVILNPSPHADISTFLIRSTDHGYTWTFVNEMVNGTDALRLGFAVESLNGGDMFVSGGNYYLSVTPSGENVEGNNGYLGCLILRVPDITTGLVERDSNGVPVVYNWLMDGERRFCGACAWIGSPQAGYLIDVYAGFDSPPWQVHYGPLTPY